MVTTDDLAKVATLYYEHGLTQLEISRLFGRSRVAITRMLAQARAAGIVEVIVRGNTRLFEEESSRIAQHYGLDKIWIAPTRTTAEETRQSVGMVGARAIEEIMPGHSAVSVALSAGLAATLPHLKGAFPHLRFYPASGGFAGIARGTSASEICIDLAKTLGGKALSLPVPLVVGTADLANQLRKEPAISRLLEAVATTEVLLMSIGSTTSNTGLLMDQLSSVDRDAIIEAGAIGDAAGHFFDHTGCHIHNELTRRIIVADCDDLMQVPVRLAIAYGTDRVNALHAAFSARTCTSCVLDYETALAVLATIDAL